MNIIANSITHTGGIRFTGDNRNVIVHGMPTPTEASLITMHNARDIAVCPSHKIADMAAAQVSTWELVKAKWRHWRRTSQWGRR